MAYFEPRTFLERVQAQREAEQMAKESGPMPRLACKCGRRLKPTNTHGQCFVCEKGSSVDPHQPCV